jgi:hypothetical protein
MVKSGNFPRLVNGASLAYSRSLAGGPQHAFLLTDYQDDESPYAVINAALEGSTLFRTSLKGGEVLLSLYIQPGGGALSGINRGFGPPGGLEAELQSSAAPGIVMCYWMASIV